MILSVDNNIIDYYIIGNKKYEKLKLNKLIDTFDNNLRFNISLPDNNNETIYDKILLNIHVYYNIKKKRKI